MATVPQKVLDLIEVFERNAEAYHSAGFKEAELRQQFLNPFFKVMWDIGAVATWNCRSQTPNSSLMPFP